MTNETQRLQIKSDGTPAGTEVRLDGQPLPGLVAVAFLIDARLDQLVVATLVVEAGLDLDVTQLRSESINSRYPWHEPSEQERPSSFLTTDPTDPRLTHGVDAAPTGQAAAYLVLSEEERAKGFVRPVRRTYVHVGGCGAATTMDQALAETYAREPSFYGATYCIGCRQHRPLGEFRWDDGNVVGS